MNKPLNNTHSPTHPPPWTHRGAGFALLLLITCGCHPFEDASSYPFVALLDTSLPEDTHADPNADSNTQNPTEDQDTLTAADSTQTIDTTTAEDTVTTEDIPNPPDVTPQCEPFDPNNAPPEGTPVLCLGGGTACCPPGMECDTATGSCACKPGKGDCHNGLSDGCETLLNSLDHCGACGTICTTTADNISNTLCIEGKCAFECAENFGDCDGLQETGCETQTLLNRQHCGACGVVCASGQLCVEGQCECVNLGLGACGECDFLCDFNEVCSDGTCHCPDPFSMCFGFCVDTENNRFNCGACANACPFGADCLEGVCRCSAEGEPCDKALGEFCCNGVCKGAGEICCEGGCDAGQACCAGLCIDTVSNTTSCGDCGVVCALNEACVDGRCACGDNGARCADGFICTLSGECECPIGSVSCDANGTTLSCVDLRSSNEHCGECGKTCPPSDSASGDTLPNVASGQCVGGVCELTCEPDWGDCDGDPQTGCETNLLTGTGTSTDPSGGTQHCGECGRRCPDNQTCDGSGSCTCLAGLTFCGDLCVNLNNDFYNCGGCGSSCGLGDVCRDGKCCFLGLGGELLCR